MFASLRRVVCPAIVLLFISIICAAALPAIAQSYTPSPSSLYASVQQTYPGEGTNSSGETSGLPSVTVSGGLATVNFDFQATMDIYQGDGTATLQYISDQESSWVDIPGFLSSSSNYSFGPELESAQVSVNNLSTLRFQLVVTAQVGYSSGNVTVTSNVTNLSVSLPAVSCTYSGNTVTMSTGLSNASIFYTLDGSQATEASIKYTGPFTAASGTTINAVAVQTSNNGVQGIEIQQGQETVADWKTVLASTSGQSAPYVADYDTPAIDYCPTQYCNQGVQGIPTTIDFLGSGSFPSASPQGSATAASLAFTTQDLQGTYPNNQSGNPPNETQVLWPYNTGTTGCDSCTSMVEDFYIWPQNTQYVSPANTEEWEMDLETWDHGDLNWLNAGLQCSVLEGGWEYSGQGGTWNLLKDAGGKTLNHDCPLPSGTLSAAITSASQSTFTVTPAATNSTIEPGMIVLIDNEEIFCSAVSGNECTSAKRGYGGTTATTHSQGARWAGSVHVQYHATRDPGILNCNSNTVECVYIDYLNLNYYPTLGGANNDNHNTFSGLYVPAASLGSTYPDRVFNQQQMNVAHGIGSTSNPVQVGEYIDGDNVTASWGVLGSNSCVTP